MRLMWPIQAIWWWHYTGWFRRKGQYFRRWHYRLLWEKSSHELLFRS